MTTPAIAGPVIRAEWTRTLLSADRVDDAVGADDLDHEGLAGRVVDREHEAAEADQREDHPRLGGAGGGEREEQRAPGPPCRSG